MIRYYWADLLRSQRFLLPMLAYYALIAILFGGDPGPPPVPWIASVLAIYAASAWLAVTIANTEDPVQRQVTAAAAGGHTRVAAGIVLTGLTANLPLIVPAVAWPAIATRYDYSPAMLLAGALAHLAAASTGTAVGLLTSRPVITRAGWSAVACIGIVAITAVQDWLPPVGAAARALNSTAIPFGALVVYALSGLVAAALAGVVTVFAARR